MNQLKISLFINLAIISSTFYKNIENYNEYIEEWKKQVPSQYVTQIHHLAKDKQQCYDKDCEFYYFIKINDKLREDKSRNKTILFVSGMHGDEIIGPHVLLYAYKHLNAANIIFFPIVNPSGFIMKQRYTYPSKLNPNRDYPIDNNKECYRTTGTIIIDQIFRKYKIDLTVAMHNGGSQIGFNWGTVKLKSNSHTQDYQILKDIGMMMKHYAGYNYDIGMPQFKVGTMNQVIYPALGTFDDWAYAATKFPQYITQCNNYQYQTYPKDMTNGLVYLLQLGPKHNLNFGSEEAICQVQTSTKRQNGYVTRAIRMLIHLLQVINPRIHFDLKNQSLQISLIGCKEAKISRLTINLLNEQTKQFKTIYNDNTNINLKGSLDIQMNKYQLKIQNIKFKNAQQIQYTIQYQCDSNWIGKGTTSFAQPRIFKDKNINKIYRQQFQNIRNDSLFILSNLSVNQQQYARFVIIVLVFILISGIIYSIYLCYCKENKKTQKIEQVENIKIITITQQTESEHQISINGLQIAEKNQI